jgi:hypothetical protein
MSLENPGPETIQAQTKIMREALESLEKELQAMRTELEKEFRRLLGVEQSTERHTPK